MARRNFHKEKGMKLLQTNVTFLMHWADWDDPDDRTHAYGYVARNLYEIDGKRVVTGQKFSNSSGPITKEKILLDERKGDQL